MDFFFLIKLYALPQKKPALTWTWSREFMYVLFFPGKAPKKANSSLSFMTL